MRLPGSTRAYSLFIKFILKFGYYGKNVKVDPSCDISRRAAPYIHLGDNTTLDRDVWLNIPYEAPIAISDKPLITIGDGTSIGRRCMITAMNSVKIGSNVLLGPGVLLADHSHEFTSRIHPIKNQGVTKPGIIIIGDGCWFGYHSSVVTHHDREIVIGKNSVIGANAVVTKSFPPFSILVGNPAKDINNSSKKISATSIMQYDEIS